MRDPNPLVAGRGFRALRKAGMTVISGVMEEEARSLNRPYCRWMESGKPCVTWELAVSMDGQIAASSGESRWISGEAARKMVHRMRAEADAVLVGGRTFRQDAPMLTARVPRGRNPKRVILTSRLARGARSGRVFAEGGGGRQNGRGARRGGRRGPVRFFHRSAPSRRRDPIGRRVRRPARERGETSGDHEGGGGRRG